VSRRPKEDGKKVWAGAVAASHFLLLQQDLFAGFSSFFGSAFAGCALAVSATSLHPESCCGMINVFPFFPAVRGGPDVRTKWLI